jgi:hypothetical protein
VTRGLALGVLLGLVGRIDCAKLARVIPLMRDVHVAVGNRRRPR